MKLISIAMFFILNSCSTIPRGNAVMKEQIKMDKKIQQKNKDMGLHDDKYGRNIQVVIGYASVIKGNVLSMESTFYVPLAERKINWKEQGNSARGIHENI